MKRINLAEPRLVPLRSRDRAEAAHLLAALMRAAAPGRGSPRKPPEAQAGGPAADLPIGPSSNGKRQTHKSAGEAA
ncbi:MAG: hypothetical protein ACRDKF_16925 [Actinomycetota bacterium]